MLYQNCWAIILRLRAGWSSQIVKEKYLMPSLKLHVGGCIIADEIVRVNV